MFSGAAFTHWMPFQFHPTPASSLPEGCSAVGPCLPVAVVGNLLHECTRHHLLMCRSSRLTRELSPGIVLYSWVMSWHLHSAGHPYIRSQLRSPGSQRHKHEYPTIPGWPTAARTLSKPSCSTSAGHSVPSKASSSGYSSQRPALYKTKTSNVFSVTTFTCLLVNSSSCVVTYLHSQIQIQMVCIYSGSIFSTDLIVAGLQLRWYIWMHFLTVANRSCITHFKLQQVLNIAVHKINITPNSLHIKDGCCALETACSHVLTSAFNVPGSVTFLPKLLIACYPLNAW